MASKGLATLIRLGKWTVDEKQRKLGDLIRLSDQLEEDKRNLEAELVREQQLAAASPEIAITFPAFAQVMKERRDHLDASIAEVERQILAAREDLAEAFRELKSYEITSANRKRAEQQRLDHIEQNVLDEVGINNFRRRQAEEAVIEEAAGQGR